jgi:hypothetical protein
MYYDHNNMPVRNGPPWSVLKARAPKPKWKSCEEQYWEEFKLKLAIKRAEDRKDYPGDT